MAYEIVRFDDDAGQNVQITPEDVRRTFCQNATDQEVQQFLALCVTQHLNPFTRDAYLVKYGNGPASIITSRSAIQKRADSNPDFEGTELGVVVLTAQGEIVHRPGEAYYKALGEQLLGGWARAYRKGRKPYYSEVPMGEYSTGRNQWAKMPGTMITKVAEMHALRGAFPQDFQGMYSPEEMAQAQPAGDVSVEPMQQPMEPAQQAGPAPTDDDLEWLRSTTASLASVGYNEAEVKPYLWARFKEGGRKGAEDAFKGMLAAVGAGAPGQQEGDEPAEPEAYEPDDIEF